LLTGITVLESNPEMTIFTYKAFKKDRPTYLPMGSQPQWNSLKKALWDNHVKQLHEASCSVASVVNCINAIRCATDSDAAPISQAEILDRVPTGHWKARMTTGGYQGAARYAAGPFGPGGRRESKVLWNR
jgi:hypothetical protein